MKATRELGEVRITVCRSRLASDSGEMESARFLVNLTALRGGGNSGAGAGNRGGRCGKGVGPSCIQPMRTDSQRKEITLDSVLLTSSVTS